MTQTNIEQDRIDFEAWYQEEGKFNEHGGADRKEMAELSWQAALKLTRERQASGEAVGEVGYLNDELVGYLRSDIKIEPDTKLFTAPQQSNIPDGYALVPIEPTPEMLEADWNVSLSDAHTTTGVPYCAYKAMLLAAPTPPTESDNKLQGCQCAGYPNKCYGCDTNKKGEDLTIRVKVGGCAVMTISNPASYFNGGIEWQLRYGDPLKIRFIAASIVSSFDYLLSTDINGKEATRRLVLMRKAIRALIPNTQVDKKG